MNRKDETPVVDENLRLILSKGHDGWLAEELAEARERFRDALIVGAAAILMMALSAAAFKYPIYPILPLAGLLLFPLGFFVAAASLREIFVSGLRIRKISGYAAGHEDFLRKYNRT
ncbi:MAG: hypothetical protein ACYYKD_13030 [Rhodospirillales bacterium]